MESFQPKSGFLWRHSAWIVALVAAFIFLSGIISPPSLMDDVDASQALITRNMVQSGDWVSARLDGVLFLDKAPLKYWMTAICYLIFGVHDWVTRIPGALAAIALCWITARFGRWAFSDEAGFYAGLFLSTCIGLFLFTRTVIPDVILTLAITLSIWAFLRALDSQERHPRMWAYVFAGSLAAGVLLKSLIGIVFPLGAAFFYLCFTHRLFDREAWRRLHPGTSALLFLALAVPWHVIATLRNPPYFYFGLHPGPGEYHGFFWFYFINEQVLRFLNARYPHDYNSVPRLYFWLLNLVWLFPWSVYLFRVRHLSFKPIDRAGQARLMALCWIGCVMVFFTFSTTQEYYSMPIYPAVALLLGCGVAFAGDSVRVESRVIAGIAGVAALSIAAILFYVRGIATPGDISSALALGDFSSYTLSMGHMNDLTIRSFAYLRLPLAVAGVAFLIGAIGAAGLRGKRSLFAVALMMAIFLQAARLALVVFDPYLSSRPIAEALTKSPKGTLITYGEHNAISSLYFYTEDKGLLLNGRDFNLSYGSYAPDAPQIFIKDDDFSRLWLRPERYYLALFNEIIPRVEKLVPADRLYRVASVGGKTLFCNQPVTAGAATLSPASAESGSH